MSWGLVLSGGASNGIANAGVLEVLEREHLKPDCIAGSSMGAIIGAIVALGHPVEEIRKVASSLSLWNVATMSKHPFHGGLHGGLLRQSLHDLLSPLIDGKRIQDCTIPFVCVAGRVKKRIEWTRIIQHDFAAHIRDAITLHVFPPETLLMDAILASSAIPVVFSPVTVDGEEFVDLCHFGPVPARSLKETLHPSVIIATNTVPDYRSLEWMLPQGWKEFLEAGYQETEGSLALCDLILKPTMPAASFRFDKAMAFWEAGRTEAESRLAEIQRLIEKE